MREILFRGKTEEGKWVYGDVKHDCDGVPKAICDYCGSNPIIPETISEFTSLTDKNGKKIFEGDIVKHFVQSDILINVGVVNWDNKNARWALQLKTMNPCFTMFNPDAFEVIGNIHDNPELLKGE